MPIAAFVIAVLAHFFLIIVYFMLIPMSIFISNLSKAHFLSHLFVTRSSRWTHWLLDVTLWGEWDRSLLSSTLVIIALA